MDQEGQEMQQLQQRGAQQEQPNELGSESGSEEGDEEQAVMAAAAPPHWAQDETTMFLITPHQWSARHTTRPLAPLP